MPGCWTRTNRSAALPKYAVAAANRSLWSAAARRFRDMVLHLLVPVESATRRHAARLACFMPARPLAREPFFAYRGEEIFSGLLRGIAVARITLRQLLDHAAEHGYGVPAFNINNMEQALAIMEAANAR
jgi:hypothetical protein